MTTARFPIGLLWVVLLIALTTGGAVVWGLSHFEDDLGARSATELERAGLDLAVRVDGRDVSLSGSVASDGEAALAGHLVSAVRGVRRVTVDVTVDPAAAAGGSSG